MESYKFIRLFILGQNDIPDRLKYKTQLKDNINYEDLVPLVDYTPPAYIDLLLTDLGKLLELFFFKNSFIINNNKIFSLFCRSITCVCSI